MAMLQTYENEYKFSKELGTYKTLQVDTQSLVSAWINLISSIPGDGVESIHGDLEENDETLCNNQNSMKMNFGRMCGIIDAHLTYIGSLKPENNFTIDDI